MSPPALESDATAAPHDRLPSTFVDYLRSFGPGLVVVLTWLGAGDIVEIGKAGADYGYSLMWVLVLAIVMRWVMVSVIARYQLCNPRGEHLLDGLCRLHRGYAPLLLCAAVLMGHLYGGYMTRGIGEACRNATGWGEVWMWALGWNGLALVLVFQPTFRRVEVVFKILLVLLSLAFLGTAFTVRPSPSGVITGLISWDMPEQAGRYGPMLVAMGMIGAVGGSLMNLVYPYFLASKGWRGPAFRKVQFYDFLLAMAVMLILDLSIWTLGAETLHAEGGTVENMGDLPWLLGTLLGRAGEWIFYAGIFAAVYTSLIGHALGLGMLASHCGLRMADSRADLAQTDFRSTRIYRGVAAWCLVSPLIWTLPGMPDFIALTLVVNALQVILLPLVAGGLWLISSRDDFIGRTYRNRWWEHAVLSVLMGLALYGAAGACVSTWDTVRDWQRAAPSEAQLAAASTLADDLHANVTTDEQGHVLAVTLSRVDLDAQHFDALRSFDRLAELDLQNTNTTDKDLRHLQGLRRLRQLALPANITAPALARLKRHLPHCDIRIGEAGGL